MRRPTSCLFLGLIVLVGLLWLAVPPGTIPAVDVRKAELAENAPLAAKYLYEGKLVAGEKALEKRLADKPEDDQARLGLGAVQFFRTFERLGASLYKFGLHTKTFFPLMPRNLQRLLPENPKPAKIAYANLRQILQDVIDDLMKCDATLAKIKDDKVKLPLHVGRIQIDLFGAGKPISASLLFRQLEMKEESKQADQILIGFDRGDVSWLRGYCHFLAAWGEALLAMDGEEIFQGVAHRFFVKVQTPHAFLLEEDREVNFERPRVNVFPWYADALALLYHLCYMPIKEPNRLKAALGHLESMVAQGKEMWKYILAETDDDNEWIPNPKQKGVLNIAVTQKMVDSWRKTLDEADLLLAGKKLLPFWRGKKAGVGVNLRKTFTHPAKRFDLIRWVQGTSATPYLEQGQITTLADPRTIEELGTVFGGTNFFGFALWFN